MPGWSEPCGPCTAGHVEAWLHDIAAWRETCLLCACDTRLLSGARLAVQADGCSWKHGKLLKACCSLKRLCRADSLATQPSSTRLTSDSMLGPLL